MIDIEQSVCLPNWLAYYPTGHCWITGNSVLYITSFTPSHTLHDRSILLYSDSFNIHNKHIGNKQKYTRKKMATLPYWCGVFKLSSPQDKLTCVRCERNNTHLQHLHRCIHTRKRDDHIYSSSRVRCNISTTRIASDLAVWSSRETSHFLAPHNLCMYTITRQ